MPPYLLSLLLLLSTVSHVTGDQLVSTNLNPLPSLYVPVGVGFSPDNTKLNDDFGMFGNHFGGTDKDAFTTCGRKTVKSLNERFTNAHIEVDVICEPSPHRVIIKADGKSHDFGNLNRKLTEECELFTCSSDSYEAGDTILGTMDINVYFVPNISSSNLPPELRHVPGVSVKSGQPENPATNVCKDKKAGYLKGPTGAVLFANEAHCYSTNPGKKYETKDYIQVPRWLQPGESVRNIRPFFFNGERTSAYDRTPYSFRTETNMNGLQFQKCDTTCDSGKVVKMKARDSKYKISIAIDTVVCTSFRICISPEGFASDDVVPKCDPGKIIDVNVKSGIVVWPNKGRSSLIELMSPYHQGTPVVVEFGYGIEVNKKDQAEYYIGNDHREIVSSNSAGFNAADSLQLAFFFPVENCLKEKAGIFSKYVENAVALSSKPLTQGALYDQALTPIDAEQAEIVTTTTTVGPSNLPHTTTLAAPRAIPDAAHLIDAESAFETNEKSSATYLEGKWWTWGIYIGFVIGTLLTLGIGGGLFYVLRRTVFGIWYRGMYKRYGCDVSGTTGGITGVGFGNTVTGDVTVQGTTGGTTVGATGTTTSGTTGGTTATETSTLLDKTSGSKSIAM
ncbi:hypothetical protein GCK72_002005 [Caenorhabditis remanei]|uniref:Glycoprotein n=1 Tax=Caenorhabditis remanei TaxID=31234 RepID=A0A6A5HVA3_CAERE|nr:hypothetical protein GCK72_002005 [Caenorhabditis remanei]KAF1770187.1 hypothetical protein GCK72_002005 [Caenorhabditis remanei]